MTGKEAVAHLNTTVFCTLRPSPIQGIGVFAIREIPEGIKLTDHEIDIFNDELFTLTPHEFKQLDYNIRDLILDRIMFRDDKPLTFISPNSDAIIRSFMNHSDDPNSDGEYSTRWIHKGDEITQNFRKVEDKPHKFTKKHMRFLKYPFSLL